MVQASAYCRSWLMEFEIDSKIAQSLRYQDYACRGGQKGGQTDSGGEECRTSAVNRSAECRARRVRNRCIRF